MRGFITLSLLMASGVAVANENLVCEYAVGDFSSPPTLLTKGSANVIFNGKSFTAYRPGGSYVVSPPLTEKKDGMIFIDDKTGNDSNLLIVFYVQIVPDDFVMQLHRF